ncbi:MAG: hypothetical protein PHW76_04280 [Alphaproteobacteria bacterium]|nr:hypothetical protein [Alphaproteobacteria bacterium]
MKMFKVFLLATVALSLTPFAVRAEEAITPTETTAKVKVKKHRRKAHKPAAEAASTAALAAATSAPVETVSAAPAPVAPVQSAPAAHNDFVKALRDGKFSADFRYRFENVHQVDKTRNAQANTLRTTVGYKSGDFNNFKVQLSGMNVTHLSNDIYNDGDNGRTNYPTIADPEGSILYLANVSYTGLPDTSIVVGRQKVGFDNLRWIASGTWRQFSQSYDGVQITNKSIQDLELAYAYLFDQNRSAGPTTKYGTYQMNTHLFHAAYTGIKDIRWAGYSYLFDNDSIDPATASSNSTATVGTRVEAGRDLGNSFRALASAEYARQFSYDNNPESYAFNYYLLAPGLKWSDFKVVYNYEYLGGNGQYAVQSPMMSGHTMNGWADKFSVIPAGGLIDKYFDLTYKVKFSEELGDTQLGAQYHDYDAVVGRGYGIEYGLDFVQNVGDHYAVGIQYADFIGAKNYAAYPSTRKVIVTGQVKF